MDPELLQEFATLVRNVGWRYRLGEFEDSSQQKISTAVDAARREIAEELHERWRRVPQHLDTSYATKRRVAVLEELDGLTANLRREVSEEIYQTSSVVGFSSLQEHNSILSWDGRVPNFNNVSLDPGRIRSIIETTPVGGRLLEDWVGRTFSTNIQQDLRQEVLTSAFKGEGYRPLIRKFEALFANSREEAITLARTYIQSANVSAQLAVYNANSDIMNGLEWCAALEGGFARSGRGTCVRCISLDGRVWGMEEDHPECPLHPRCRCVLLPKTKTWAEMGMNVAEMEKVARPYTIRIDKNIGAGGAREIRERGYWGGTFEDFLWSRSRGFRVNALGKVRADLMERGDLSLRDLVDGRTGRLLTLAELGFSRRGIRPLAAYSAPPEFFSRFNVRQNSTRGKILDKIYDGATMDDLTALGYTSAQAKSAMAYLKKIGVDIKEDNGRFYIPGARPPKQPPAKPLPTPSKVKPPPHPTPPPPPATTTAGKQVPPTEAWGLKANSKRAKVLQGALEGKTLAEIASASGFTIAQVKSQINVLKKSFKFHIDLLPSGKVAVDMSRLPPVKKGFVLPVTKVTPAKAIKPKPTTTEPVIKQKAAKAAKTATGSIKIIPADTSKIKTAEEAKEIIYEYDQKIEKEILKIAGRYRDVAIGMVPKGMGNLKWHYMLAPGAGGRDALTVTGRNFIEGLARTNPSKHNVFRMSSIEHEIQLKIPYGFGQKAREHYKAELLPKAEKHYKELMAEIDRSNLRQLLHDRYAYSKRRFELMSLAEVNRERDSIIDQMLMVADNQSTASPSHFNQVVKSHIEDYQKLLKKAPLDLLESMRSEGFHFRMRMLDDAKHENQYFSHENFIHINVDRSVRSSLPTQAHEFGHALDFYLSGGQDVKCEWSGGNMRFVPPKTAYAAREMFEHQVCGTPAYITTVRIMQETSTEFIPYCHGNFIDNYEARRYYTDYRNPRIDHANDADSGAEFVSNNMGRWVFFNNTIDSSKNWYGPGGPQSGRNFTKYYTDNREKIEKDPVYSGYKEFIGVLDSIMSGEKMGEIAPDIW